MTKTYRAFAVLGYLVVAASLALLVNVLLDNSASARIIAAILLVGWPGALLFYYAEKSVFPE